MTGPPQDDDGWLLALGATVSDGGDVDWAAAEARATDSGQLRVVRELRRLAALIQAQAAVSTGDDKLDPAGSPDSPRWRHLLLFECVGTGAFGQVYRGYDPRLDREVAVKLLAKPDRRTDSPLAEARHLARIRHPHVVTVYGADEDAGHAGIWMEYLKGETLGTIVEARGPFSAHETIGIALDLCGALSAIHGAGLFHRDIKADNVMRETGGRIVLMDFSGAHLSRTDRQPERLTGTPLDMAPELLEGAPPSAQGDVYSLGVLLFYLLSGEVPVEGATAAELREAHARGERRRLRDLRADVPEGLLQVVDRATAPDPARRVRTPGELAEALAYVPAEHAGTATAPGRPTRRLWWLAGAAVAALAAIGAIWRWPSSTPEPVPVSRFAVGPPYLTGSWPRLSPDGRLIVFGTDVQDRKRFWIRPLDSVDGHALMETVAEETPFWSPDSRRLAFFERGKLKVISADGGSPQVLADAPGPHGGDWLGSTMLYARSDGIYRFDTDGHAAPVPLTHVDETLGDFQHGWPQFLPDGRRFLYVVRSTSAERAGLYVGSLDGIAPRRLMAAASRTKYARGYIFYVRNGALMAQEFDERSAMPGPGGVVLAPRVQAHVSNDAAFDVTQSGVLIYSAPPEPTQTRLVIKDRAGRDLRSLTSAGAHYHPRFSPDGTRVVAERIAPGDTAADLWLYNLSPHVVSRLTRDPAPDVNPVWSPDGHTIVFSSKRGDTYDLYTKTVDGVADETLLLRTADDTIVEDWSADGRQLFASVLRSGLWALPLNPPAPGVRIRATGTADRWSARLSPDGRWIAYSSSEDGERDVFVEPFPGTGSRWQVSSRGGGEPRWGPGGRELLYLDPQGVLMSLTPHGSDWRRPVSQPLFRTRIASPTEGYNFDVSPDGRTFVLNAFVSAPPGVPVEVVINWPSLISR